MQQADFDSEAASITRDDLGITKIKSVSAKLKLLTVINITHSKCDQ